VADQAENAHRSQISGDIEIGAIALCSRPIRSAFSKIHTASALEIQAALQIFELERFLFDLLIPRDREAR
jgi:hypothetical protein